jgi:hypothetical protein
MSSPTVCACEIGTNVSLVPKSPVLTVTQAGSPVWSSTKSWPTLPTFSPSLSMTLPST